MQSKFNELGVQIIQGSRWKSPVLWAAITAQLLSIFVAVKIIDVGLSDEIRNIVSMLLQLGVTVGVLNNPTNREGL